MQLKANTMLVGYCLNLEIKVLFLALILSARKVRFNIDQYSLPNLEMVFIVCYKSSRGCGSSVSSGWQEI